MEPSQQPQQHQRQHNKVGVADYYAILGVGDRLVWKHEQKQNEELCGGSGLLAAESASDEPKEEERFVREIVQITIIVMDDAATTQALNDSTLAAQGSRTVGDEGASDHRSILNINSYRSESSSTQPTSDPTNSLYYHNSLSVPPSPSNTSEATSAQQFYNQHKACQQLVEDGWTLIRSTLPSASPGFGLDQRTQDDASTVNVQLWNKFSVWDANLAFETGLRARIQDLQLEGERAVAQVASKHKSSAADINNNSLRAKVESKIKSHASKLPLLNRQQQHPLSISEGSTATAATGNDTINRFYLAFRRRETVDCDVPGIADVQLMYVRLHRATLPQQKGSPQSNEKAPNKMTPATTPTLMSSLASQIWMGAYQSSQQPQPQQNPRNMLLRQADTDDSDDLDSDDHLLILLKDYLESPPEPFDEWSVPEQYRLIRDPTTVSLAPRGPRTTVMFTHANEEERGNNNYDYYINGGGGMAFAGVDYRCGIDVGVEAVETLTDELSQTGGATMIDPELLLPKVMVPGKDGGWKSGKKKQSHDELQRNDDYDEAAFCYIPVLAVRRQRFGEEQRFHEDPALTDIAVSFCGRDGHAVMPCESQEEDDEEAEHGNFSMLGQSSWSPSLHARTTTSKKSTRSSFGMPVLLLRRNLPFGFADTAFATRVWGRFPFRNYSSLP